MPDTFAELIDGFEWHKTRVMQVALKAPTGRLHAALGEPSIVVYTASGDAYEVDQPPVLKAWCEALIAHEGGSDILPLLTLTDSMILREAVKGFFSAAAARIAKRKQTPSSSAPAP